MGFARPKSLNLCTKKDSEVDVAFRRRHPFDQCVEVDANVSNQFHHIIEYLRHLQADVGGDSKESIVT